MPVKIKPEDALRYHSEGRPGKIGIVSTKPVSTQRDLSLAYTPGVAEPTAGGFPAISAPVGQFLLKDLVLLAASASLLRTALARWQAEQS